uniref:Uncharacterized protein n=1 Tax=Sipha flava TaxID=143950 RepID=A0A2S2QK88_9HEMI
MAHSVYKSSGRQLNMTGQRDRRRCINFESAMLILCDCVACSYVNPQSKKKKKKKKKKYSKKKNTENIYPLTGIYEFVYTAYSHKYINIACNIGPAMCTRRYKRG